MLVLHAAILADADALAVLAQLLKAGLLALAGLEAFGGSLVRRSHGAMTLRIFLLFLGAVLGLRQRRRRGKRNHDRPDKFHFASFALEKLAGQAGAEGGPWERNGSASARRGAQTMTKGAAWSGICATSTGWDPGAHAVSASSVSQNALSS